MDRSEICIIAYTLTSMMHQKLEPFSVHVFVLLAIFPHLGFPVLALQETEPLIWFLLIGSLIFELLLVC